jgi:ankyrin repeat protein
LLDARYEEWNERPIEAAGHMGNRPIAEYLLAKGAPLNIFAAAMLGMTEQVGDYLAADPNLASANGVHGISILFHAAMSGKVEIADLLVANGGGQDASNALHGAAAFGHTEMARWLLARGAEPNPRNWQEKTPLQVAQERGFEELAALLREAGGE